MQILSYRGPAAPGGVSSTLSRIVEEYEPHSDWWFVGDSVLRCNRNDSGKIEYFLDKNLIVNHYRYCNNFLWPLLHDMPERAHYSGLERQSYKVFNSAVARRISATCHRQQLNRDCFVNDYQLALLPGLLEGCRSSVFWHIPWPKNVRIEHIAPLAELASSLTRAKAIGFHTDEYAHNFMQFIRRHVPHIQARAENTAKTEPQIAQRPATVALPLGVDSAYWEDLAKGANDAHGLALTNGLPYILSVDRADYTKGILERLRAIDHFFRLYPQWRQKVVFLQLGARSRSGLKEFDKYWAQCQAMLQTLTDKWSTAEWKPVIWLETPTTATDLASIYAQASVMLVSPLRDGLNLTAKEFVLCQNRSNGVLALSPGAGVFTEIGRDCVRIDPEIPGLFARCILRCLEMSESEKATRARNLKARVIGNGLSGWWSAFRETSVSGNSDIPLERVC